MNLKKLTLAALVALLLLSCNKGTHDTVAKKVTMENRNLENTNRTIKSMFINGLQMKEIECPTVSYGIAEKGDVRYCFGSSLEPEELINMISNSFEPIATTRMGWREDIGIWITTYQLNKSKYRLSVTMKMPASRDLMRNDSTVNKYKTIVACYITT